MRSPRLQERLQDLIAAFEPLSCEPGDDSESRTRKAQFTVAMTSIIPAGLLWGAIYFAAGARLAAVMPLAYSVLSAANLAAMRRTRRFRLFQIGELALIVALPFALQLALGGFVAGSAVVVWAFLGPLFAVLFGTTRDALIWFGAFVGAVVVAGIAQPSLSVGHDLPHWLIATFFVMNLAAVATIAFGMLVTFVKARDRYRTLERAYLDQEVILRQREKLATLGTLAAGVAHELNNPAAAVQRAAEQLAPTIRELHRSGMARSAAGLRNADGSGDGSGDAVGALALRQPAPAVRLTPVQQSAREQEMEEWLEDHGVDEPWEVAPTLVSMAYSLADLDALSNRLDPAQLAAAVTLLAQGLAATSLTESIAEGARRISAIVSALRSYSYLDRGTVQTVDVTEGLESTLVLLQAKLHEMKIEREYASDVPPIAVRGNELNQVWTNILDNAIDATGGTGTIVLRTSVADGGVVVELEDDGPGMASEVAARVFDPFFTTKPPGHGTGLGLNISYNIVVRQHAGEITVESSPGRTCFRVVLPLSGAVTSEDEPHTSSLTGS